MKKKYVLKADIHNYGFFIKIFRIMRISAFLLFIGILQVFASDSYSQVTRLTLSMSDATINQVLEEIEAQSEFYILFNHQLVDVNRKVNIQVSNKKISNILTGIFKDTDVEYLVMGRQIILSPEEILHENVAKKQWAQDAVEVTGTVTDEEGNPLPGVNVIIEGTQTGTITNADGGYIIEVDEFNATLIFSFVGYDNQAAEISGRAVINITLAEKIVDLDELIVVGYGTQKQKSLTGAISQINSDELTVAPSNSVTTTLAGRLNGLVAKQSSGGPGAIPSLSIRGFNTAGESALVIVDGIERSFDQLDPNEIESVTILKDASAAIYGARAASGVILVTTKRGKIGKPIITLNSSTSLQSSLGYPGTIDAKTFLTHPLITAVPSISDTRREGILNGTIPSTSFQDELLRKYSLLNQHNMNIRGGNDIVKFFVSVGYMNQGSGYETGDYPFNRFNTSSNLDIKISENLTASLDMGFRRSTAEVNPYGTYDGAFNMMQLCWPVYPIYNSDGSLSVSYASSQHSGTAMTSEAIAGMDRTKSDVFNGSMALKYKINSIPGMTVEGKMALLSSNDFNKDFFKKYETFVEYDGVIQKAATNNSNGPTLSEQTRRSQRITSLLGVRYDRYFNEHYVSGQLFWETLNDESNYFWASRDKLISAEIPYLFSGGSGNQQNNGNASQDGRSSFIGRVNYSYAEKYYITGTLRADAVPRFPSNSRWGYFPGVELAWRLSDESFLENSKVVDYLKLRLSAATLGNDNTNGAYDYIAGYSIRPSASQWYYTGNTLQPAISTLGIPNLNITWQESAIYNMGIDAHFLDKGNLFTSLDVFYRKRTKLLAAANSQIPGTVGASLPLTNINSRDNRGFEATIGYKGGDEFRYGVTANVSWTREKYIHYEEPEYTSEDDIRFRQLSGNWVNRTMGYVFDGFFNSQEEIDNDPISYSYNPRPGDIRYVDFNGDGVVDGNDRTVVGKGGTPEWMIGMNFSAEWKGFDFTMFWQGAAGFMQNMSNWERIINPIMNRLPYNYVVDNVWSEDNKENARFPERWTSWNRTVTDEYLIDSKYLRLKNLIIGYTIPKSAISKVGIEKLRVYMSGTNLLTIDNMGIYGEFDPENSGFGSYPNNRLFSFGLNLSF